MKVFMVSDGSPEEGAVLVFAHSVKEAKLIGFPAVSSWNGETEWIDLRVSWLKDRPWLFKDADKAKLAADIPHANDNPTLCKSCELWGNELNADGICSECATIQEEK